MELDRRKSASLIERQRRWLRAFGRAEDGSMVIFSLFIILLMLMIGGMAVDLMRFETNRSRLQATLDRAVLAAADLDQTLDPEAVVRDYFDKAGLLDELSNIVVTEALNSRTVSATAALDVDTMFMGMLGIDNLTAPAAGTATESLGDVEISLVLDVSGSMGRDGRIQALRPAAQQFVTTVFEGMEPGRLSVSVVPYSTQVNLGPTLFAQYNTTQDHTYSFCINLPADSYSSTALDPTTLRNQTAHFDPDTNASRWSARVARFFVCDTNANSRVLPFSGNETTLRTFIGGLQPYAWTSIEMGAKWGVALLDPSSQPVVNGLISAGVVDSGFSGRPFDYTGNPSLKIMILMTDGENTRHYELDRSMASGLSDVWLSNGLYYVDDQEPGDRDGDGRWREQSYRPHNDTWTNGLPGTRQTWPQLLNAINLNAHARYFRRNQTDQNWVFNSWFFDRLTRIDRPEKDARLDAICDAAKAQGIVIFAIGFQVSDRSADVMESCASSPSHFYRVEDLDIATAFNSIANQINALRLVQ